MWYLNKLLIAIIMINIAFVSTLYADNSVVYDISHEKIAGVSISISTDNYYVVRINLAEPAALFRITRDNIGRRLAIVFAGRTLTSAIIQTAANIGQIQIGRFVSAREAIELVEFIFLNAKNS